MRHVFIASDTYQVMLAADWAHRNGTPAHVYCTDQSVPETFTDLVTVRRIGLGDPYRKPMAVAGIRLTESQYMFYRDFYSRDLELHVFGDVDLYLSMGCTDLHLHEAGESSYLPNGRGLHGEDDDQAVADVELVPGSPVPEDGRRRVVPLLAGTAGGVASAMGLGEPPSPEGTRAVLYVHNEPDTVRYSDDEIAMIHQEVHDLLAEAEAAGYEVWVKDHHKRAGRCDLPGRVFDYPVELADTSRFLHVVSVRSRCVADLPNGFNGVTLGAVVKCTGGFAHAYMRGLHKLRMLLGLPYKRLEV